MTTVRRYSGGIAFVLAAASIALTLASVVPLMLNGQSLIGRFGPQMIILRDRGRS